MKFNIFKRSASTTQGVILIQPQNLIFGAFERLSQNSPVILKNIFQSNFSEFKQKIEQHNYEHLSTTMLLTSDYQIKMLDILDPSDKEISFNQELLHLFQLPIDEVVYDYMELPPRRLKAINEKFYVCATTKHTIQKNIEALNHAVKIFNVQIIESSIREFVAKLPDNEDGIALIYLHAEKIYISLIKNSKIFMTRDIILNLESQKFTDDLVNEVYRSFEYCQTHYSRFKLSRILVIPNTKLSKDLLGSLSDSLGLPARYFGLTELLADAKPGYQDELPIMLGAYFSGLNES